MKSGLPSAWQQGSGFFPVAVLLVIVLAIQVWAEGDGHGMAADLPRDRHLHQARASVLDAV